MVRLTLPLTLPLTFLFFVGLVVPAGADTSRQVKKLVKQLRGGKAEKAASQLADLGQDALPATIAALSNKNWKIRYWAAYALAYNKAAKEGSAIEALKRLLGDRKKRVRLRAAMALVRLGDKGGLDLAREHLQSSRAHLRAEAVAALAASGDAQWVATLRAALRDPSAKVRYWALLGLRDLAGKDALADGLQHLSDGDSEVQVAALEVVDAAGRDSAGVEEAVLRLLSSRLASIRQRAASVLAHIGGKKSLAPLRKLRDEDRAGFVRDTADAAVVEITKRLKAGP